MDYTKPIESIVNSYCAPSNLELLRELTRLFIRAAIIRNRMIESFKRDAFNRNLPTETRQTNLGMLFHPPALVSILLMDLP